MRTNTNRRLSRTQSGFLGAALLLSAVAAAPAQDLTTPCPNRVISWNLDDTSTVQTYDLAGLAPAYNWVDSWLNNITIGLPDNEGNTTTLDLGWASFNTWHVGGHPALDLNGTANKEMLNGYLNSGPAGWNPPITNTYVSLTNIPYAKYDVVVYFNSDTSGRHGSIDNGSTTYYFSTMGTSSRSGDNALFLPSTETNSAVFPPADFAFFPGMTSANAVFTENPKSGNDQWLGICAFQVIESSNVYVLYGPSPASQAVPLGQSASFKVMAGGEAPTYQWRHAGTNILNATNATYTIAATAAGQDGDYDVVVSNSFSSVTSLVATLTFYSPKQLDWTGTSAGWTWDTSDTAAWTADNGATTLAYTETDDVLFGTRGIAESQVYLSGKHTPSSVTVSNASYTISLGEIAGSGALNLVNNATLILDTAHTSTGPVTIGSGSVLQVGNGATTGALGSGALTNNGSLVYNRSDDEAYGYPIQGAGSITNLGPSGTITFGNTINASSLVQSGAGTLLLQGDNNITTGMLVSGGTVWARSAGALGGAPVRVEGGQLQLFFGFDYVGSAITLAGGMLHGGGGAQTVEEPVTLEIDSTILVDGGSLTLSNAAGFSGGTHVLTKTGAGSLILAGANNTWGGLTISAGTVQIGNGGATGNLGSGTIANDGALAFNLSGNLTVTNVFSSVGEIDQIGTGITTLTADNTTGGFVGAINVTNGTLLINGTSGYGAVTVAGGSLGGTGTIDGAVTVLADGALAPGASVGTLTLSSDLTLGGNLSVEVDKSLTQSNDLVVVNGTPSNTGTGVVTVANLGPALVVGDSFKLFSQPLTGGETLTIANASGNVTWTNKLAVDGTIAVLDVGPTIPSYPTNISFSASGGALSLTWPASHQGWILQSQTNALSTGITTNWTDVSGSDALTATNFPVNATSPAVFFRLRHP